MPLNKKEREELAKKIKQQRRSVWRGKPATKSKTKKIETARSVGRISYSQQEPEQVDQPEASRSSQREAEKENKDYKSRVPAIKVVLIVIACLMGAIALGIAMGYLAAVRNLINI